MLQPPSADWQRDGDGDVPLEEGEQPPRYYERELDVYKDSMTPVNPDKVAEEEVNHREYLRQVRGCGVRWGVFHEATRRSGKIIKLDRQLLEQNLLKHCQNNKKKSEFIFMA